MSKPNLWNFAFCVSLACLWFGNGTVGPSVSAQSPAPQSKNAEPINPVRDNPEARSRIFYGTDFQGSYLKDLKIISSSNAFQKASFRNCNLAGSVLTGGVSSFQLASFDGANLVGSRLTGDGASFQSSSFVKADLTQAILVGDGGSTFQRASFQQAVLVDARLVGNFQLADLSGANLQGADLTGIKAGDLATCRFDPPPTYNARTRLPAGFDPVKHRWKPVK